MEFEDMSMFQKENFVYISFFSVLNKLLYPFC